MRPVALTAAITGSIHTPSMSPHLPFAPADIARHAIDAARAGASILHLHARDPETGEPSAAPERYAAFLPEIAGACDAIVNITTGGGSAMSLDDRLAAALAFEPELCSLNMGSMNFALHPLADKRREWRFDWEQPFLRATEDVVFKNTPRDIARILDELGERRGARFEFECYDTGHLHMLAHFLDKGAVEPPLFVQFVFGVLGGMAAELDTFDHVVKIADRLFGDDYAFSALAAGRHQLAFAERSIEMGGHARVGLEDNLRLERGVLARSSAEQVERVAEIAERHGRRLATPEEARAMLGAKGAARTRLSP